LPLTGPGVVDRASESLEIAVAMLLWSVAAILMLAGVLADP
jgi:hypothetical protein